MLTVEEIQKRIKDSYEVPNNVLVSRPKVLATVRILAYNHSLFIANCIDSILAQKTNFDFELIIGEDFSTDGTREIVFNYANKYPDIIRIITADYNVGFKVNLFRSLLVARGKYVAICDGDDFWTDPFKLQKQVDFLENNENFTLTCGGFVSLNSSINESIEVIKTKQTDKVNGFSFDLTDMLKGWLIQTLTVVYRKNKVDVEQTIEYKYYRDVHLFYHLIKNGKGFYFTEIFGVYRKHSGGIFSSTSCSDRLRIHLNIYGELYEKNKDNFTRRMYLKVMLLLLLNNIKKIYKDNVFLQNWNLLLKTLKIARFPGDYLFIAKGIFNKILL